LAELHKDRLKEGMNAIADLISTNFAYKLVKDNAKFEAIGKKKHPEYQKFQNQIEIIQAAFKLMDADKGLDAVKAKAAPALAFFNGAAAKYKTGNKDQEKLKHICLYNQALAYFWLEEFDQAETYAKPIQKFDIKDRDAKRLLDDIEYTRSSLQNANRTSRHQVEIGRS
jgi:hypothetical protein